MERLGETLSRLRIREALLQLPADPTPPPPEPQPACARCRDAGFLRIDVPIGHPDFGKLVPCACRGEELLQRRREKLERLSNLGPLVRMTFETLLPDGRSADPGKQARFRRALEQARAFAGQPAGWLVFVGPSGAGKTHLAASIANARLSEGEQVIFSAVPDLLDHLRATFSPSSEVAYDDLFEAIRNCSLLVLDDLGVQSGTPWAQEKLFQVLNHRYNAELPTIVTTNIRLEDVDERMRSRLGDPVRSTVVLVEEWEANDLQRLGGMSHRRLQEMTFESFDPNGMNATSHQQHILQNAQERAQVFAENPEGWLILLGEPGTGKTHLAASIANYRRASGQSAYFVVVPDFLDYLRATYGPESTVSYDKLFDAIRTAPLIVLDDLGAHFSTPWAQEKLYQLLNYRYNAKLPTVVTTNLNWDQIEPRLRSRMLDQRLSTTLEIQAPPFRLEERAPARPRRAPTRYPRQPRS